MNSKKMNVYVPTYGYICTASGELYAADGPHRGERLLKMERTVRGRVIVQAAKRARAAGRLITTDADVWPNDM